MIVSDYFQIDELSFVCSHFVIPSEELRVLDYSLIQQKYMLDGITTLVLTVSRAK